MTIRSGRFVGDAAAATTGIEIINGFRDATYRIFNSGSGPFGVFQGSSSSALVTVPEGSSVDIYPKGVITIKSTVPIDGIYDILSKHRAVRSGRFTFSGGTINPTEQLIATDAKGSNVYRIMNSGEHTFEVKRKNSSLVNLKPKMTIDVEVKMNDELSVVASPSQEIEGIYFHLNQISPVKSGRFRIDPRLPLTPTPIPTVPHTIIDATGQTESYYRIFNSGDFDFQIEGLGLTPPPTVKPDLSFDFKITNSSIIKVKGLTGATNDPIEGIYEYLGED